MKYYEIPECDLLKFNTADVITTSAPIPPVIDEIVPDGSDTPAIGVDGGVSGKAE